MKSSKKIYYVRKGGRITELVRIRIDGFPGEGNNAPPEPLIWQSPIIIAPTLYGVDGSMRHSTEIECLVRYTWAGGHYFCVVQEAGTEEQRIFLQRDNAKWLAQLERQIGSWLQELYGGVLERSPVPLDGSIPPPPDEIVRMPGEKTVSLIDGDLPFIACPATESIPAVGDEKSPLDGTLPNPEQANL